MRKLDLCDGKYTVVSELEDGGGFYALRYGESWRNLSGDKLVYALFAELEEAKEDVERLRTVITDAIKSSEWGVVDSALDSVVRMLREATE